MNPLDVILIGNPVEAMEAAKQLVQRHNLRDVESLVTIISNKMLGRWSRLTAIWALGYIDDDAVSVPALEHIRQDDDAELRNYAAEALEHIGESP